MGGEREREMEGLPVHASFSVGTELISEEEFLLLLGTAPVEFLGQRTSVTLNFYFDLGGHRWMIISTVVQHV